MRHRIRFTLAAACAGMLAAITPAMSQTVPQGAALQTPQSHAERIVQASKPLFGWPKLVEEARKYLGTNPTARKKLWCATFMNLILAKSGYAGTHSDAAKSFAYYGRRISEPQVGAIAVLTRGKRGGHVGVVSGVDSHGNPVIISGNHNRRVGEAIYPRSRVIAYVMPTRGGAPTAQPTTQLAARSVPARAGADAGIESPIVELLNAIEAEVQRAKRAAPAPQPARTARPAPPPQRVVQQSADERDLPLDPALADLLGISDRDRPAPPRRAPQRERRVQQEPGRMASNAGLAEFFGSLAR